MDLSEQVAERLLAHGVKPTPQRMEIAQVILRQPCHLSAEQIIAQLRQANSRVSKATVYNTLKLFSERGILREVAVDPSRLFFDSTTKFHHHFYNQDTGELIDIDADAISLESMPELPEGTVAESIELVVRVRNSDC